MSSTLSVKSRISSLLSSYDPENDTIPGTPRVTYADSVLANAILEIAEVVASCEERSVVSPSDVCAQAETIALTFQGKFWKLKDMSALQRRQLIAIIESLGGV